MTSLSLNYVYAPYYPLLLFALLIPLSWLVAKIWPFYDREMRLESAGRLPALDGLRGVLSFGVLCHHAVITANYLQTGIWTTPDSNLFTLLGQSSVAFFFCVTGFLFWSRVLARGGVLDVYPFLRARVFRIVPLMAFSSVVAIALVASKVDWLTLSAAKGIARVATCGLRPWGDLGGVKLFYVDAGVTWTLQYEWGFYVLVPALALLVKGRGSRLLLLLFVGMYIMFGFTPGMYFFAGILAAHAMEAPRIVLLARSRWAGALVLLLGVTLPFVLPTGYSTRAFLPTTLIFVIIACGNSIFGILELRGLRLMGVISYSVYLLHGICLYTARPWLQRYVGHLPLAPVGLLASFAAIAVLTLLLSAATYRLIEWPMIHFERRTRTAPYTSVLVRRLFAYTLERVQKLDAVRSARSAGPS